MTNVSVSEALSSFDAMIEIMDGMVCVGMRVVRRESRRIHEMGWRESKWKPETIRMKPFEQ
jgi:hypothetical protein